MDVNSEAKQIACTDQLKFAMTYNYDGTPVPLTKIRGGDMISDVAYLNEALVTVDQGGYISIYEFQMGSPDDVCKIMPISVA